MITPGHLLLMLIALPTALQALLVAFLWPTDLREDAILPFSTPALTFHLRHHHAVSNSSRVVFADFSPSPSPLLNESLGFGRSYTIPTTPLRVPRPPSFAAFSAARWGRQSLRWEEEEVPGPDVTMRESLLQLAGMAYDTYFPVGYKDWYDVDPKWKNETYPFGWGPDEDGMRGHVFVSSDNSTVVIAIKGTSAGWLAGSGGPTTKRDKLNDNLLFSCCCARVGPSWWPVCGCYRGSYTCDEGCVQEALVEESLFYPIGTNLYNNVSYMYPTANIWLVGHSLGGGLASLLGATFGAPVVAFEAVGEKMASRRLHLPSPPSTHHITHVYHTADPVPMGTCTGVTSLCALDGLALESRCHLGQIIQYDTITHLRWSSSVRNHPIQVVIDHLLSEEGEWNSKGIGEVPEVKEAWEVEGDGEGGECQDCYKWNFEASTTNSSAVGFSPARGGLGCH